LLYILDEPVVYEGSEAKGYCSYDSAWINSLGIKQSLTRSPIVFDSAVRQTTVKPLTRRRRDADESTMSQVEKRAVGVKTVVQLSCEDSSARCHRFDCVIGEMLPKAGIAFKFRARLWNSTFVENYAEVDEVRILSVAQVEIDAKLNIQQTNYLNDILRLETVAIPDITVQGPPGIPLWIIIVSIIAGVLLLALVIFLMWKCGFFRRNRRSDMGKYKAKMQHNTEDYHD
jgi:hypothetical protein